MKTSIQDITRALAPGIALTSVIFYNNGLQARLMNISARIRDLNREARQIRQKYPVLAEAYLPNKGGTDSTQDFERLRSIQEQTDIFMRRSLLIRWAILVLYTGFFSFVVTILGLLVLEESTLPLITFALGFCALGIATIMSIREMSLSHRTLLEDTKSSYS
jgi:hypothetical protein